MNNKRHRGKVWQTFALNFSTKHFMSERLSNNNKKRVSSVFQPPRSRLIRTRLCPVLSAHFSVLDILMKHSFTCLIIAFKQFFFYFADNGCVPRWDFHPFLNPSALVRFSITDALWNVKFSLQLRFSLLSNIITITSKQNGSKSTNLLMIDQQQRMQTLVVFWTSAFARFWNAQ